MKKRSISFLLGLFLLISLISGCGGGGGGRDKGDGDKGSGSNKPYYYGTIKIQRDGTVNKLEIHELETITVYLYLDNGSLETRREADGGLIRLISKQNVILKVTI
jgi:hypothetical protein